MATRAARSGLERLPDGICERGHSVYLTCVVQRRILWFYYNMDYLGGD